MEVLSTSAYDASGASVVLGYAFDGADKGYSFKLTVHITYTLEPDGRYQIQVAATNRDPSGWSLPFFNG